MVIADAVTVELHMFSDASERAYGACAYIQSINQAGLVQITLLTSRSKVAPLKCQSIPRLELCGALLAAQVSEKVLEAIKIAVKVFFWTDSTCVLQWLKAVPITWTTFVANRVAKIQNSTVGRSTLAHWIRVLAKSRAVMWHGGRGRTGGSANNVAVYGV